MNTSKEFDLVLDECIDLLIEGGTLHDCLALYPELKDYLEPLLLTFSEYSTHNIFVPSSTAKSEGRAKLQHNMSVSDVHDAPSMISNMMNIFTRPFMWAPIAAVALVLLICLSIGVFSSSHDDKDNGITIPVAVKTGKLEIRVTDAPAYDISAVYMTISDIQVQRTGTVMSGYQSQVKWENVIEGSMSFELLSLRNIEKTLGEKELPVGNYSQINNRINRVLVTVDGTDKLASLSNNLIIVSGSFSIEAGVTTILVMDINAEESVSVKDDGEVSFDPVVSMNIEYKANEQSIDVSVKSTSATEDLPTDEPTSESLYTQGHDDNIITEDVNQDDQVDKDSDDINDNGDDPNEGEDDDQSDDYKDDEDGQGDDVEDTDKDGDQDDVEDTDKDDDQRDDHQGDDDQQDNEDGDQDNDSYEEDGDKGKDKNKDDKDKDIDQDDDNDHDSDEEDGDKVKDKNKDSDQDDDEDKDKDDDQGDDHQGDDDQNEDSIQGSETRGRSANNGRRAFYSKAPPIGVYRDLDNTY